MFTEPLAGWRKVDVRSQKTSVDWAQEIAQLLERDYPDACKVVLVCDNLNTHKSGSLYEAFAPERVRLRSTFGGDRLEVHYTPKHGPPKAELNVAEIKLSVLTQQCLDRRMPDRETLEVEARAWGLRRNAMQKSVDWQFTTKDARIKLKRLYPQIKMS
jgi:hypothetical protein